MYKRLELHNHTTESDANLTPEQLVSFMLEDRVNAFALTDHNTISGHKKIREIITRGQLPIGFIRGMEYTTYYGHILCLNLTEYVPWENINLHKPELLFNAAREKGALVGVAHPFSYGHPFARGCRFDMTITDFSAVDFIEIFNNPEPLHEVNEPALLWWEKLVLKGHALAATCGMDLHGRWEMGKHYATYIEGTPDGDVEQELGAAIRSRRTWVSKGPLLEASVQADGTLTCTIRDMHKPGYVHGEQDVYCVMLKTVQGVVSKEISWDQPLTLTCEDYDNASIVIPKLYRNDLQIENLVCVAPVIVRG